MRRLSLRKFLKREDDMGNATYTVGETPSILLNHCRGSVEIEGGSHGAIKVSSDSMPHTTQQAGQLVIEDCDDDLRLEVPPGSTIRIEHADGEVRARHLASLVLGHVGGGLTLGTISGQCSARHVEGDVRVRDTTELTIGVASGDLDLGALHGRCNIEHVDGDLRARAVGALHLGVINGDLDVGTARDYCRVQVVNGDVTAREVAALSVHSTNGDLDIEGVEGPLELHRVQGDARIRGTLTGLGPTQIQGDLDLDVRFQPESEYRISVDGDGRLNLRSSEHLTLRARVRGDVHGLGPRVSDKEVIHTWGTGAATLHLTVSGDLHVRGGEPTPAASVRATTPAAPIRPAIPAAPVANAISSPPAAPTAIPGRPAGSEDAALAVLEAVARGDLSPEEAETLLAGQTSD